MDFVVTFTRFDLDFSSIYLDLEQIDLIRFQLIRISC